VLYEGINGWMALGYPVFSGQVAAAAESPRPGLEVPADSADQ
jgi:hypothetical protein